MSHCLWNRWTATTFFSAVWFVLIIRSTVVLRLDHEILICKTIIVVMDDVLWWPICYVSQKWYSWDCDVWHNGHLNLKIRVLTPDLHGLTRGGDEREEHEEHEGYSGWKRWGKHEIQTHATRYTSDLLRLARKTKSTFTSAVWFVMIIRSNVVLRLDHEILYCKTIIVVMDDVMWWTNLLCLANLGFLGLRCMT